MNLKNDAIFKLNEKPLKLEDNFKCREHKIPTIESQVKIRIAKYGWLVGWLGFMAYQHLYVI